MELNFYFFLATCLIVLFYILLFTYTITEYLYFSFTCRQLNFDSIKVNSLVQSLRDS